MEDLSFLENKKFTKDKCQLKSDYNPSCSFDTKPQYKFCYYDKDEQSHIHFKTIEEANEYQIKLDIRQGDKIYYGAVLIAYIMIALTALIIHVIIPNIRERNKKRK